MVDDKKKYKLGTVLARLEKDLRTGTLICVGEDNVQGRVYFQNGRPVSAKSRNLQGREALERINQNLLVSLKFHGNANLVDFKDDADISDVTFAGEPDDAQSRLEEAEPQKVSEDEYRSLVDISTLTEIEGDPLMDAPMTAETRKLIIAELVEYLGPVASIFVSDLDDNIRLIDALDTLAREIGDMDAGIEFFNKVKAKL